MRTFVFFALMCTTFAIGTSQCIHGGHALRCADGKATCEKCDASKCCTRKCGKLHGKWQCTIAAVNERCVTNDDCVGDGKCIHDKCILCQSDDYCNEGEKCISNKCQKPGAGPAGGSGPTCVKEGDFPGCPGGNANCRTCDKEKCCTGKCSVYRGIAKCDCTDELGVCGSYWDCCLGDCIAGKCVCRKKGAKCDRRKDCCSSLCQGDYTCA